MELKAFKVLYYRPILDSGWVDIDDITVVVGKNESGKTALLRALHKFNPFKPEPYVIDREWPRGHRGERRQDAVVVETRFEFTDAEKAQLAQHWIVTPPPAGVHISKTYKGSFGYSFFPNDFPSEVPIDWLTSHIQETIGTPGQPIASQLEEAIQEAKKRVSESLLISGVAELPKILKELTALIETAAQNGSQV
jgi:hypothetical protein